MLFDENTYLKWYIPRLAPSPDTINLHSSGMPPVRVKDLSPPPATGFEVLGLVEERLSRNLAIPKEELVFTSGATGGTLLALLTLGARQKHFVVETPIYEPMMQQAKRLGEVRLLPRTYENRWQIDLDRASTLIDDDTAVVLITEPNNPGGVFSSRKSIESLAALCRSHGAHLLINEVYLGFSARASHHGLADNVIIVNSYSKLLGAYSNRVGWLSGQAETMERLRFARLNMGTGSVPSAAMGIAFADEAARRTQSAREAAARWVNIVDQWIETLPEIDWIKPEGPGFGAVILPDVIDDLVFVNRLYDEEKVLAVPGCLFFTPGTVRISWLNVGNRLDEGLDCFAKTLKQSLDSTP